jgi:hypothetical protein
MILILKTSPDMLPFKTQIKVEQPKTKSLFTFCVKEVSNIEIKERY